MDNKFIFHIDQLPDILDHLRDEYRVLTIGTARFSRYETQYFDTPALEMYTYHHNGKLNRYKVRFRKYLDSETCFFEIKFKSNKGRTVKDRIKLACKDYLITPEAEKLLTRKTKYDRSSLREAIRVNYNRITLVRNNLTERLTIDISLRHSTDENHCEMPSLVIAEVKQDRTSRSPFLRVMQDKFIPPYSISKYCLGIASLYPGVKKNNFKPKLLHVNKLCTAHS